MGRDTAGGAHRPAAPTARPAEPAGPAIATDPSTLHREIHQELNGSFVVSGSINVRTLNRTLGWTLPTDGPRTLNGLIFEHLESIPEPGTSLKLGHYRVEILQMSDNVVKMARLQVS